MNVKFFSRPARSTSGHVVPVCFDEKFLTIPFVDSRTVYVDLAPVTLTSRSYTSSSAVPPEIRPPLKREFASEIW